MKNNVTWWWLAKLLLFLFIQSFNMFILFAGISYLHPDFTHGYLSGKSGLFDGFWFPTGLFLHAFSAPIALLIISLLVIFRMEYKPKFHRLLGKLALMLLFFCVVPSGWILSYFAMGGTTGKFIFFFLSSYTAYAALNAYVCIRKKSVDEHKYWMHEVFALLLSAILLRLLLVLFGFIGYTNSESYIVAALLSWIPSISVLKLRRLRLSKSIIKDS